MVTPAATLEDFKGKWGIVVSGPQIKEGRGQSRKGFMVAVLSPEKILGAFEVLTVVRKWVEYSPRCNLTLPSSDSTPDGFEL